MTEETKERLTRLRAIHGAQRATVTKNVGKVNEIIGIEDLVDSEHISQLKVISRLLDAKLKTLEEIDQEVLSLCNVDEIPQEIEESEKYVEKVITCQKRINDFSQQNGETQETNPLAGLIQTLPGGSPPSLPTSQVKAKLPKLVLPKFRGDVTTWMGFWDSYKSAVHDNVNLSKIDKFNYLRSLVEGATSQAIQGLALSSDNYDSEEKYSSNDLAKHNRSSLRTWMKF